MLKIAFVGFRHSHVMGVYKYVQEHPEEWQLTGACEEDDAARRQAAAEWKVAITHTNYAAMLDAVECDVVAVGDYYAKRGQIIIAALQRGKHVLSDKPVCTDLRELEQITQLAKAKNLKIGCQLDLRASGNFLRLKEIVRSGKIGEVLSVAISGQHPLSLGTRPAWYFEPGKHGGTINDIGIHAFDFVPWITGCAWAEIVAARVWPALAPQYPHFQTGAQFMLRLDNQAGVMGDMSYFKPERVEGKVLQYWRTTIFGSRGIAETSSAMEGVSLACQGGKVEMVPPLPLAPNWNIPHSFAREVQGAKDNLVVTTDEVLYAARVALLTQQAADKRAVWQPLPG